MGRNPSLKGAGESEANLTVAIVNPELSWTVCQSGGNGESGSGSSLEPRLMKQRHW